MTGLSPIGIVSIGLLESSAPVSGDLNLNVSLANITLTAYPVTVTTDLNLAVSLANITLTAYPATISTVSDLNLNVTLANITLTTYDVTVQAGDPFVSDVIVNNTGVVQAGVTLKYTFWPYGRIGTMSGITPTEGTVVTDGSGVASIPSILGQGVMMLVKEGAGVNSDSVYYQGWPNAAP